MTRAYDLYKKHTMEELVEMSKKLEADPANRTPPGSFYLYDKKTRIKQDAIGWAITFHLQDIKRREMNDDKR